LLRIRSCALAVPVASGANRTPTVHEPPIGTVVPEHESSDTLNSSASPLEPAGATLETTSGAAPVFETVTSCEPLADPTAVDANDSDDGEVVA
jgi:hypothetical protein